MTMSKFWQSLLYALPLNDPESNRAFPIGVGELADQIRVSREGLAVGEIEAFLCLTGDIFARLGLLDAERLSRGEWAFVSYSARLAACSFAASLAGLGEPFFDGAFWLKSNNARSRLFKEMETRRDGVEALPIRQNIVAWGVLSKEGEILLYPREISNDDIDNEESGKYVLPGGRMRPGDMEGLLPEKEAVEFLYGVPGNKPTMKSDIFDRAYLNTLAREMEEELGLREGCAEDYTVGDFHDLAPYEGIYGGNDRRVKAVTWARLFFIRLTLKGILTLAQGGREERQWRWFARGDLVAGGTPRCKVFLSAFRGDYDALFSEASDVDNVFVAEMGNRDVVLPVLASERLELVSEKGQRTSFALPNSDCVDLLLYLGWKARGFLIDEEHSGGPMLGWVRLPKDSEETAELLSVFLKDNGYPPLTVCRSGLWRLAQAGSKAYFSPSLFRGWLRPDRLELIRGARILPGLGTWQEETRTIFLSSTVITHVERILEEDEDAVFEAHDRLKNMKDDRTKKPVLEILRTFGLRQLIGTAGENGRYEIKIRVKKSKSP
jgi:8-oxo-dGTP pyrophosphatase MutT (NUDIX family)